MTNLARFFIDNNKFTMVLTAFLLIFGVGGLLGSRSELFPTVNLGTVVITTRYDGATALDIETKITKPIEDKIRTVRGIKDVISVSQPGLSKITTVVDIDRYEVETVVSDLQRAIDRVTDLPPDLENPPSFLEVKSEEFPVIELAVVGPNPDRLRDRTADALKEELADIDEVVSVQFVGLRERQFNIYLDKAKLDAYHIGVNEVMASIQARNITIPGGELKANDSQQLLRIEGKVKEVTELEKLVIRSNFSGNKILLGQVARIEDGEEDARYLTRINGEPATFLIVNKRAGTDMLKLVAKVGAKLDEFRKTYQGQLQFVVYNNEGRRVENRVGILSSNAIAGLFLVVFFLLLFLPGRVGLMASLSLPITLMATFGYMSAAGISLNSITILALIIALGMLVDNSVVIAEDFARLRSEGMSARDAALRSIELLWLPITATVLTTIAAFLPMLVTSGIIGQFIRLIPILVSVTLIICLIEGFFFLPMRLVMAYPSRSLRAVSPTESQPDWFSRLVLPRFNWLMALAIDHRYVSLLVFSGLIGGSLVMMGVFNKFILFPASQTEIYIGRAELKKGTRLEKTDQVMAELAKSIREAGGEHIENITTKAGFSETVPTDPKSKSGARFALVMIYVDEFAKDNISYTEMLARLRAVTHPDVIDLDFEAAINGPPLGDPVSVTFRSNNGEQLANLAEELRLKLTETPGIVDAKVDDLFGDEEVFVRVDYEKASRLGLDLRSVGNTVRAAVAGRPVSDVNLNNKKVDLVVRLEESQRRQVRDLMNLKIEDARGNLIPLSAISSLITADGSPFIKRFDFKRSKTVTANVDDVQMTAASGNALVTETFAKLQSKYPEVSITFGGEGEKMQESFVSLMKALVLSLIGIFALLVFMFRSYLRPFIIMTTIPLGLIGVSVAFFLHGRPISFLAVIGIIGLGGVIVNSGIVLISFIDQLREEGRESLRDILIKASGLRLRAVVVTSLTTISGLLPTAYGIGGADEFIIPMAMSLAWGLTSGTVLSLIWVPAAYAILEDLTMWASRRRSRSNLSTDDRSQVLTEVSEASNFGVNQAVK